MTCHTKLVQVKFQEKSQGLVALGYLKIHTFTHFICSILSVSLISFQDENSTNASIAGFHCHAIKK